MHTGQRIASLRDSRDMTQKDLSKILGVSQAYVGQWESGTRTIPTDKLYAVARYFDVSADYLLGIPPKEKVDLKQLLQSGSMTFGGSEISEKNIKVLSRVVQSFLEETTPD